MLVREPASSILDKILSCGFDDRNQMKTVLGSFSYDLLCHVLRTWPQDAQDAPFVYWLSDLVQTSFRQVKFDKKTGDRLFTQLQLEPLEMNENAVRRSPRALTFPKKETT